MKNKKLNFKKVIVTNLDNLHSIKGGRPGDTECKFGDPISKSCTAKQGEDDFFTEEGTQQC
ncbi:hypothetical protein [Aquimarina spongiae]|uniref:Uncharacterized protein n=1 Tax=Aquimarina spongiae TaxID=570521 RepID=A0A1M6L8N1_9FLAO|nr:hypothetical protein [Aquimarina spongiae]SHJ67556.1 hypothetical protein SAMN04488508_11456 [Aquimarina spongiae]